jgi:glycosyltransferase involved in cell wall biosynthesis
MKVGLLIYGSLNTISGGYLYDRMLVAHLRACGDEVVVMSLSWGGYGRQLLQNFSHQLYRQLVTADFDVLLQDELNHPSLFWLNRRLRQRVTYPIISIVHHLRVCEAHPPALMGLYRRVERAYLQSVDGFIYNSQTTCQETEKLAAANQLRTTDYGLRITDYGLPTRPYTIAYPAGNRFQPAITEAEIIARAQEAGPLRVLFVGNLIPRKGLHRLIEALCQLNGADWRLDVVGSTAVNPAYTRQIQTSLTPNITLHGALPDEPLAALMRQSHVLAVPSQYEGFGIVYLEGMGFGLPAIGTTAGAAWEIIEDGVNGYLVEAGQTIPLAQRLQHLQQNRNQLATMSLAARRRFLAHPTWQQSMATIRQFLLRTTRRLEIGD